MVRLMIMGGSVSAEYDWVDVESGDVSQRDM